MSKKKRENGGERKPPVMPRGGMRIKKPGRGPVVLEGKKKKGNKAKGRMEEKRSLLLCHGVA